jgi:predicted Holliday junction resolvase-like endonuclease
MRTLIEAMKLEREIKGLTRDKVDDLRSILLGRIAEAQQAVPGAGPEFSFDPQMSIPDGPEGNPSPAGS